jgi:hypothetical protein
MKRMMDRLCLVAAAIMLSGCTSTTPLKKASVEIVSEPPGVKIEVNSDYIGTTPCTAEIPANIMGEFTRDTSIRALPAGDGQQVQTKNFSGGFEYGENDLVPKRILFDMTRKSASN